MVAPSGDQASWVTFSLRSVSRRGSPPLTGMTKSCMVLPSSRFEVKASVEPSGDQHGSASRLAPEVNARGAVEPSRSASQIRPRYSLASESMPPTTNATVRPSGDTRGSLTPVSSYTSLGAIPVMFASRRSYRRSVDP